TWSWNRSRSTRPPARRWLRHSFRQHSRTSSLPRTKPKKDERETNSEVKNSRSQEFKKNQQSCAEFRIASFLAPWLVGFLAPVDVPTAGVCRPLPCRLQWVGFRGFYGRRFCDGQSPRRS